jgi:hypothetical protein
VNKMHTLLHGLAIKKHATPREIAPLIGMSEGEATALLERAVESGRAIANQGKYALSPLAQVALHQDYSRHYAELRDEAPFVATYEKFESINIELKSLITRWQTMDAGPTRVPNDHSDRDYDLQIIDQLGELHERVEILLTEFEEVLPRFAYYRIRLLAALENAEAGNIQWVSSPAIESYHTLWFELHEDLLRLLGRLRSEA